MDDLVEQIERCFQGSVCIMGLGNPDYGDDGLGAVFSETLTARLKSAVGATGRHEVLNGGTTPEHFIIQVSEKGYSHLIFIDAVEFGGAPGSVIFIGSEKMAGRFPSVSTHKISAGLLARWIEAGGTTKAWLLGVQPGSLQPAKGLTGDVQATLDMLEDLICGFWVSENNMDSPS